MRFSRRPATDDRFPREQRRLLLLVLSLGLTIILMSEVRKARRWRWLWRPGGAGGAAVRDGGQRAGADAPAARRGVSRPIANDSARRTDRGVQSPFFPGVMPSYLDSIRDDTVFRQAEQDAWFNLLRLLRDHGNEELSAASIGRVGLVALLDQPRAYRGKLITVAGQARRALYRSAPANRDGIEGYYQVVLRPAGGPNTPLIVYCLQLPEKFPVSQDIAEDVVATGFFFKNCAYSTGKEIHSYPTIVARTLEWNPPVAVIPRPIAGIQLAWLLGGTAAAGLLIAWGLYWWSGRAAVFTHSTRPAERPDMTRLEGEDVPIDEALGRLAVPNRPADPFPPPGQPEGPA